MTLYKWSRTAAADATADPSINWAEGQAPSSVNDSGRAMMAATAKYRDDITGAIVTSGSATAYVVSSYQVFDSLAHLDGQMIAFTPHVTNGAIVTLNVDSLGAKPLRTAPNTELFAGTIIQGTPYMATYNNSDGVWYLQGFYGNPFNVPLSAGMDYWGPTAPSSAFAFPTGQAISRTAYAALFALIGTTYGPGDGTITFNLPDKAGRVSAMKETASSRLTSSYFGGDSTQLGAVGTSNEKHTLTVGEMPSHGHTAHSSDSGHSHPGGAAGSQSGFSGATPNTLWFGGAGSTGSASASITTTIDNNGGGNPHAIVQPTIICNYIMRIL